MFSDDDDDDENIPTIDIGSTKELFSSQANLARVSQTPLINSADFYSDDDDEYDGSFASSLGSGGVRRSITAYPRAAVWHLMLTCVGMSASYAGTNAIMALYLNEFLKEQEQHSVALSSTWLVVIQAVGPIAAALSDRYSINYFIQRSAYICWFIGSVLTLLTAIPTIDRFFDTSSASAMSTRTIPVLILAAVGALIQAICFGMLNVLQPIFVGDQFDASQPSALRRSFSIFYFFYNFGLFCGEISAPVLRQYVSYEAAFVFCCCFEFMALVAFVTGRKHYRLLHKNIVISSPHQSTHYPSHHSSSSEQHQIQLDSRRTTLGGSIISAMISVRRIIALYSIMIIYWALFIQQNNTWVYQAKRLDRQVIDGVYIPADLMPSLEDVFAMVFLIGIDAVFKPILAWCGIGLTPLRRMAAGLICCAFAFGTAGLLQLWIEHAPINSLSVLWQLPQLALLGMSEALTVTAGLAFGYEESPPSSRAGVLALWSIMAATGAMIVVIVAEFDVPHDSAFFGYGIAMAVGTLLFIVLAQRYRYVNWKTISMKD